MKEEGTKIGQGTFTASFSGVSFSSLAASAASGGGLFGQTKTGFTGFE